MTSFADPLDPVTPPAVPPPPPLDDAAPRRPRPRVWPVYTAFPVVIVAAFLLVIACFLPLLPFLDRSQPIEPQLPQLLTNPLALILTLLPFGLAQSAVAFLAARLSPIPFRQRLGFLPPRLPWPILLAAALGAFAYAGATTALFALLGVTSPRLEELGNLIGNASGLNAVIILVYVGILGPFAEECFFRGYIQTRLVQRHGPVRGILITAFFFGLFHFDPAQSSFAFDFGIYLGIMAHRASSIFPSIVAHMFSNSALVILAWTPGELGPATLLGVLVAGALLAVALLLPCLLSARRPLPAPSPLDPSSPPAASHPPAAPPRC